ncbi:MAG: hypothetical protein LBT86_06150 [Deltaproteobacteria bacterium]|jgi:hypothetical protein|nr:hypothetical protein [Deltaproteobacteria bacterium]
MKTRIFIAVFSLTLLLGTELLAKDDVSALYQKVDDFIALRDKLATTSANSSGWDWIPFFEPTGKTGIQNDINEYLDQTLAILLDDAAIKTKEKINQLAAENRELVEKIAQYELAKPSAPTEGHKLTFWKTSVSQYDDKIADANKKIDANNLEIAKKRTEIKDNLAKSNIYLTEDQIKTLLITVSGQDQLDALVALKNLYSLADTLKNLIGSTKNLIVYKKYYGVFLLATEAHEHQLSQFLRRIKEKYLPKLKTLKEDNLALMAETKALAANNPIYSNNLAAQKVTDVVADKYRDLLISQRQNLETRLKALNEVLKYVDNTYRTVNLAANLATSLEEGINTLKAILETPILPPVAFENNLEATFLELSEKIAQ